MAEDEQFEERNGWLFCKKDGLPLQRIYMPRGHKGGFMRHPSLECPKCKQQPTDAQLERYSHLRI
jgi:hypothetical protein